jgi:AraC-like DNA-binding protein
MNPSSESSTLCRALRDQIIPWIERWGMQKILVAPSSYEELMQRKEDLPPGMTVTPRPLRGKRQALRSHVYGSASVVNAKWPEDNLQAARTPKLYFILAGSIHYPVGDYQVHCQAGHGLILPPGVPFALDIKQEYINFKSGMQQCKIFQLLPYQNSLNCWISTKALDEKGKFSNSADVVSVVYSKVPEYLKSMTSEALRQEPFFDTMCRSWLQLLTHELYRELGTALIVRAKSQQALIMERQGRHNELEIPPSGEANSLIPLAQKYISQNLAAGLSIDVVADYICMSRSVFTEKFRQHTGLSFTEYVTQIRLQEAQTLLRETDLSIIQISKTVGVTSAWLRKLFQENFAISPIHYRAKYR